MTSTWLLLDGDWLAHVAFYSLGHLRTQDATTGTTYGFLKALAGYAERHDTTRIVFCFDGGNLLRKTICPDYKSSRKIKQKAKPKEERIAYRDMKRQTHRLRDELLTEMGFRNVLFQDGYEADDIIASVVQNSIGEKDEAIIISGDHDLFQLIGPHISMITPKRKHTYQNFSKEFGVSPIQWIDVKAMAGCITDDVPGIRGVGEKTAVKYLNGSLTKGKLFDKVVIGTQVWKNNRILVKLPFSGCLVFKLKDDRVTKPKIRAVCRELGFRTLLGLTSFVKED